MNYYLARDYKAKNIHTAGSKARRDIEQIMEGMGFHPAGSRPTVSKSRLLHFIRTIAIVVANMITEWKNVLKNLPR